jgi:hypothetical protein
MGKKDAGRVIGAYASTDCPSCGCFVSLSGQGRAGESVRLVGQCENGHTVFYNHVIPG